MFRQVEQGPFKVKYFNTAVILTWTFVLSVIDIQAFERLLGPCMDIMKRNISQYEEQRMALFGCTVDLKN